MLSQLSAERKMGSATSEYSLYIARLFCGASVPQNLLSYLKDTFSCYMLIILVNINVLRILEGTKGVRCEVIEGNE